MLVLAAGPGSSARGAERLLDTIVARRVPADPRFEAADRWVAPGAPTLALALSGGGARGAAHVGVLQEMWADGLRPDAIAATSIGALIGALIAGGYEPDEVERIVRGRDWGTILSGLDVRRRVLSRSEELFRSAQFSLNFRRGGRLQIGSLAESGRLQRELYRLLLRAQLESGGDFDRLRYRYRPVCTDVLSGTPVVPAGGDLIAAVRGSSAVPGVFQPVPFGDTLLVDGGLVENIPVETARALGTDLVVAVDVTLNVEPSPDVGGALDVLGRSLIIVSERREQELLAQADLVLAPEVQEFSQARLQEEAGRLIESGRMAYRERRAALWRRLESAASDREPVDHARIEVEGTEWTTPAALADRLGGTPGTVTRFRVAAELARALGAGPFADGRVEWVERDDARVLRFVFREHPPVRAIQTLGAALPSREPHPSAELLGERYSADLAHRLASTVRRRLVDGGQLLVGVRPVEFDPGSGTVTLRLADVPVRRIDTEVEGETAVRRIGRFFDDLQGSFDFDGLADRLDELVARGAIYDWRLTPRRTSRDAVDLVVHVRADDFFQVAAGAAFRTRLGFAGFARGAKSNITGRGDFAELALLASRDILQLQARYLTEYGVGFQNLGAEVGARYFDNAFLVVDEGQKLVEDDDETYSGERGWISLIRRMRFGAVARAGLFRETVRFDGTSLLPAERRRRTSAQLEFELNRHERLLFPERGGAVELRAEKSLAGYRLWTVELDADLTLGLGRSRRHTLTLRAGGGVSEGADRRPFWFNPGGYRNLYGFLPYGAAAPQYARAGIVWRQRLFDFNLARVYVETGVNGVTTALDRRELGDNEHVLGYGASVVANASFIGPVTFGVGRNDLGAELVFVTVGFPFPGE